MTPVTVYLPQPLYNLLRTCRQLLGGALVDAGTQNLEGDRDIEWSWVAAEIPFGSGQALDVGAGPLSYLGLVAARKGFDVTVVDLAPLHWHYAHSQLHSMQGDILKLALPAEYYDLVINCSTIEHVGLAGRYNVTESRRDGDLEAMAQLRSTMKPGAKMLLTIPVGSDAVFAPLHRTYGAQRLPLLLDGFEVEKKEYWMKNSQNCWVLAEQQEALTKQPQARLYGLGCFVLRRS